MPLHDDMQLVSVDDHLIEKPTVWTDRIPAKYADVCPRIIEVGEGMLGGNGQALSPGSQVWTYEGRPYPSLGLNAVAGLPSTDILGFDPIRFDAMLPGCYDAAERVKDMDLDGVAVQTCFPNFPKFAGGRFLNSQDPELARLCIQAWNDYVLDEWCAVAPDRFIPLVMVPFWDVDASVAEIERTAAKGARTVTFPENPVPLGLPSFHTDHWDRVFSAAAAARLPLSMHFGTSGFDPVQAPDAPLAVMITLMGTNSLTAMADLMFSPVFHRHPDVKIVLAEGGIGWIPWLLERAEWTFERHRFYQPDVNQKVHPRELFRRHFYGCFIDDVFGVRNRHDIGVNQILWEVDYPHSDSRFPLTRKVAAATFAAVPDDEVARIVEWNARELFDFPRTAASAS
jgi:predicted TIM-barrel fold metal-dependent hydrolase